MGNSSSATATTEEDFTEASDFQTQFLESPFEWPANLYVEARDMMAVSFLTYSFAYILETARREETFEGLSGEDEKQGQFHRTGETDADLRRSFTPSEVIEILTKNIDLLKTHFPEEFEKSDSFMKSLQLLQDRAKEIKNIPRPLTLEDFDDRHFKHELVYGITVDRANKRVTLSFRGTENELSFTSNWGTNVAFFKKTVPTPPFLKEKKVTGWLELHSGFYDYLFEKTFDDSDDPNLRKYDEILNSLMNVLASLSSAYRVYVTGHSLGGALASVAAFYLALDDRIPKPVTCITAGQPRVGDHTFMKAVQVMEKEHMLRYCRLVNDNDAIAFIPTFRYYHAGFQIRLPTEESGKAPEVTYPKINDTLGNKLGRTWNNSLFANANLQYDHGDYRERLDAHQAAMENLDLNNLYADSHITGWVSPHAKLDD